MITDQFLVFDGIDDYADAGDQPAHRITGNLTLEAWVYAEPIPPPVPPEPNWGGIITKLYTDGGVSEHGGYGLLMTGRSLLFYVLGNGFNLVGHAFLTEREWHHIACTYDGASLTIFVDGILCNSRDVDPGSGATVFQPDTSLYIGRFRFGPTRTDPGRFPGKIAEARVWNVARTVVEIKATMNDRLTGSEPGLVGYWPLDDRDGATARDRCGVAPLTLHGATFGVVATSAVFSAALERLNRTSVLGLLDRLTDVINTTAVFTATRHNLPDLGVHYQFRSANVAGFPAEFDLRFANPRTANVSDHFDADTLTCYVIVDLGTNAAPSAWSVSGGALKQVSNIHGDGSRELGERGTYALMNKVFAGGAYEATCRSADDDGLGLVWNWMDADNFYMAYWDGTSKKLAFTKVVAGVATLVRSVPSVRVAGQWYTLTVISRGDSVDVYLDGAPVLSATDSDLRQGCAGVFTVGCTNTEFDRFSVSWLS